jgi:hypothetical protein
VEFCGRSHGASDTVPLYLHERCTPSGRRRLIAVYWENTGCGLSRPRFTIVSIEPASYFKGPRWNAWSRVDAGTLWSPETLRLSTGLTSSSDPTDPTRFTLTLTTADRRSVPVDGSVLNDDKVTLQARTPPVALANQGSAIPP